ncbi:hypothetical protein HK100_011366 [Physocladia obscura]|uniref:Uncharacterized protein n=1 Tax=Physocladia obscura TaxID=109957 RepID=A0AAD5XE73_9FUNG|nr:hypothetical protein HK100_011366 [Physocladia obscura]
MQHLHSLINDNEFGPIPNICKLASGNNKQQQNYHSTTPRGRTQFKPWCAQDASEDENECNSHFQQGKSKQYRKSLNSNCKPNFFADNSDSEQELPHRPSNAPNHLGNDEGFSGRCGNGAFAAKTSRNTRSFATQNNFEDDDDVWGDAPKKSQNKCQIMSFVKTNIVDELLEDRERDELQALLIKKLIKSSSTTRNRVGIIQALVSGQNVAPQTIAKLLAQDCIMDHMSKKIICNLLDDFVANRHADHIIHDLVLNIPHLPDQNQKIVTRENFIKDKMAVKHVQKLTAPNANKIVTKDCILDPFEMLTEAENAGYGSRVTPRGIKYSGCCDQTF